MKTEKVACPHCNELMWINVPDDRIISAVQPGYTSYSSQEQKCPNCKMMTFVEYREAER